MRATLIWTWERWDARPGDDTSAKAMNTACDAAAAAVGVDSNYFRARLAEGRRAGRSREQILERLGVPT